MINFDKFELANGLKVIVHEDKSTPMVAVNILYNIGSKDEKPERTGFAHLFEHLMFGGSENIPDFDEPMQWAGGESNAFTNSDITNFYDVVPAENLEVVFWMESDRMNGLVFSEESLNVQRKVVVEEFKETCLAKPYGDVWHNLMKLAYKKHPYRWPTIGLTPQHIEEATLQDVKQFFYKYYRPNNAIISVAGNTTLEEVKQMSEKWFGDIQAGQKVEKQIPQEPEQTTLQYAEVQADVPLDALYMAFHVPNRGSKDYYAVDLLSDVLCHGQSSRLYRHLLKDQKIFTEIDCYITGSIDPGLLIIEGKFTDKITKEQAEAAIWKEIDELKKAPIADLELQKHKNKIESSLVFTEASILNKAMNLGYFELLGNASKINRETEHYLNVTVEDIYTQTHQILKKENCSELYYKAKKKNS